MFINVYVNRCSVSKRFFHIFTASKDNLVAQFPISFLKNVNHLEKQSLSRSLVPVMHKRKRPESQHILPSSAAVIR